MGKYWNNFLKELFLTRKTIPKNNLNFLLSFICDSLAFFYFSGKRESNTIFEIIKQVEYQYGEIVKRWNYWCFPSANIFNTPLICYAWKCDDFPDFFYRKEWEKERNNLNPLEKISFGLWLTFRCKNMRIKIAALRNGNIVLFTTFFLSRRCTHFKF